MPSLRIITHEFEIVSDGAGSDLERDEESREEWIVDCTPDDLGVWTPAIMAARALEDLPVYLEPDVMPGTPSWYSGCDGALEGTEFYVGLEGFTPGARDRIEQLRNPSRRS